MNEHYLIYRHFIDLEEATGILKILQENNIPGEVKFVESQMDPLFSGDNLQAKYELKISGDNFEKADVILDQLAEKELENYDLEPDYYLYQFSNDELMDVLTKPHEWNTFDVVLAKSILRKRNVHLNLEKIEEKKQEHLDQLVEPEKAKQIWIVLGYIFAFFGGFLGLLIGSTFYYTKKVLPDGSKVPVYDENTRKHAFQIFVISLIVFPVAILLKVWMNILEVV